MKLNKINKITQAQLKQYKSQTTVTRRKESTGGYEYIVFGTDQDLD